MGTDHSKAPRLSTTETTGFGFATKVTHVSNTPSLKESTTVEVGKALVTIDEEVEIIGNGHAVAIQPATAKESTDPYYLWVNAPAAMPHAVLPYNRHRARVAETPFGTTSFFNAGSSVTVSLDADSQSYTSETAAGNTTTGSGLLTFAGNEVFTNESGNVSTGNQLINNMPAAVTAVAGTTSNGARATITVNANEKTTADLLFYEFYENDYVSVI